MMYQELTEQQKHAQANTYKDLCAVSNEMVKMPKGTDVFDGWKVADAKPDQKSNFKGVLYEKDGQYVMCFVGTDKFSVKDHAANMKMGLLGKSEQMRKANEFYQDMKDSYNLNADNCKIAGHSEGGTEATYVGINNGIQTYTYNAFGISKKLVDKNKNYDNLVINYRDPHDPVSKMKSNVGKTYITESTQNAIMAKTPLGLIQSHAIIRMGDCTTAQPIEEYKKSHPLFLDKISEVVITREDIAEMPSDLYSVYENIIDERMAAGQIPSNYDAQFSVLRGDMVYVNGYTKDDGTEVKGYYRSYPTV